MAEVEHWLVCRYCGEESEKKMVPKEMVEKLEATGMAMRPAFGICPECQEDARNNPMWEEGAYGNA